ncbi:DUF3048 domain-containing protein [Paenibacillus thermotolerans]|uniref:DUF3048 domain-containing protein n=1 Tax=Paenibacillus thermotolerans TaxID=3027807 RepID=UPI002368EA77|nr:MULTISPECIES: DUF3048 domain-containing protein [unclassified Paenibacillus]
MKKWLLATLTLSIVCLLAACGRGAAEEPTEPETPPPAEQEIPEEPPKPAFTAPLTGLGLDRPVESRPFLLVINNHSKARPQSGLSQADLFYEVLAEGEITRILAVFQSHTFDGAIGPVRSIRPYFIDIGKSFDAIDIHAGGSPDGYAMLKKEGLDHLDEITNAGPYYWRDKSRKAPHNLYTNLENIGKGVEKKKFATAATNIRSFSFLPEDAAAEGEVASAFDLTFLLKSYKVSYQYDSEQKVYKRFINDEPHTDLNNNEQLSAANVVVMEAPHKVLDDVGRRAVDLSAGGKAKIFQQGKVRPAEWRRNRTDDAIRLYINNEEVGLVPGQTHFLIIPDKPGMEERLQYRP